jgi:hypothetical protein
MRSNDCEWCADNDFEVDSRILLQSPDAKLLRLFNDGVSTAEFR